MKNAFAIAPLLGLLAPQEGYVETRRMLPLLGDEEVHDAAVGDVDGDGDLDLFVARDGHKALLLNRGEGLYDDRSGQIPQSGEESRSVALADLDGDGDLDAYVANGYTGTPNDEVLANDGTGAFTVVRDDMGGATHDYDAEASDVDLDGDVDVVVTNSSAVGLELRRNVGPGLLLLTDPGAFPPVQVSDPDAALRDLDGDSDADVLVVNWYAAFTLVNDGTGHFGPHGPTLVGGESVDLGDVDGDLDPDAYVGSDSSDRLLLNDGSGMWSEVSVSPSTDGLNRTVAFVDLDEDGDLDVARVDYIGVFLLCNDGAGALTDVSTSTPFAFQAQALAVVDADGDQDPDLVVFPPYGRPPHLWLNAFGLFFEAHAHPSTNQQHDVESGECAIGDVNGDGTADLISSVGVYPSSGLSHTKLLLNSGKAVFTEVTATHMPPVSPGDLYSAELADADGDGDLDLALGFNGPDHWYRNGGAGVFTDVPGALAVEGKITLGLKTADLDGDGDLDQVSTYSYPFDPPPPVRLFLGDGSGTFLEAAGALVAANPNQQMRDPTFVDVDADGDLDVFLGGATSSELHTNSGSAVFHHVPGALPAPTRASSVAVGDVDGDGDYDVALGNYQNSTEVHVNNGAGAFSLSGILPGWGGRVELIDEEQDGDLDALSGVPSVLFRNNGVGTFTPDAGELKQPGSLIGLADLDGDADVDLVFDDSGRLAVATRVAGGQFVWRSLPRASKDQHLEVFGPAGTPYALAGALGKASIPLPPFGTLLLDPATLVIAASGWIPAGGVVSLKAPVPDDQSLVGVTIWWQAIVGNPLKLTNADPTTLSAF